MKLKNIIGYAIGIAICCLAFFFVKEFTKKDVAKEYTKDGFSITLEGNFEEKEQKNFDIYYESLTSFVAVLKEDFDSLKLIELDENSTLEEYGKAVLKSNNLSDKELHDLDGKYKYFEYDATMDKEKFYYIGVVTKGSDSFWLINFCSEYKNKDEFKDKFINWAKTIKVN